MGEFFGECGTVSKVKMLTDRDTGAPRGIAFVDFEETESTDKAVAKSGTDLKGKEIFVKFNAPREKGEGKDGKGKASSEAKARSSGGIMEFKGAAKTFDDDSD